MSTTVRNVLEIILEPRRWTRSGVSHLVRDCLTTPPVLSPLDMLRSLQVRAIKHGIVTCAVKDILFGFGSSQRVSTASTQHFKTLSTRIPLLERFLHQPTSTTTPIQAQNRMTKDRAATCDNSRIVEILNALRLQPALSFQPWLAYRSALLLHTRVGGDTP